MNSAGVFFSQQDFLEIKSRLIGGGRIGEKAVGMLLSRKTVEQDQRTALHLCWSLTILSFWAPMFFGHISNIMTAGICGFGRRPKRDILRVPPN